jgi:hypothetical protein
MRLIKGFLGVSALAAVICWAYEERPDADNHREQDRRFRDAQERTGATEYENNIDRPAWNMDKGDDRDSSVSEGTIGTYCRPD